MTRPGPKAIATPVSEAGSVPFVEGPENAAEEGVGGDDERLPNIDFGRLSL